MSMLEHGLEMALEGATKRQRDAGSPDQRQARAMALTLIILLNRNGAFANDRELMADVARLMEVRKQQPPSQDDLENLTAVLRGLTPAPANGMTAGTNGHVHERRAIVDQLPP